MIKILADPHIPCIEVSGHAGFAESGKDIVCAGVSSIVFSYLKSVRILVGNEPICIEDSKKGYLKIIVDEKSSHRLKKIKLLYKSMLIGLKEIEKKYPDYVRIYNGGNNGS